MPLIGFECPKCGKTTGLEDGPMHLHDCGAIMAQAAQALIDADGDERRMLGGGASPSIGNADTTCRRELLLRRHYPYTMNPFRLWAALEGVAYHKGLLELSGLLPDWEVEVGFPREEDQGLPGIRRNERWHFLQAEVWPGVWMSARVDAWNRETGTILNLKSTRTTKVDYGFKKDWGVQSNLERMVMEKCGVKVQEMEIWRVYKGCYDDATAWRKFIVPRIPDELLREQCEGFLRELIEWDDRMEEAEDKDVVLDKVPLEGLDRRMFNGKKCTHYCSSYKLCMAKAGRVVF